MSDNEMLAEHKRAYDGFVKGTVFSIIGVVIVLAGMALFLL